MKLKKCKVTELKKKTAISLFILVPSFTPTGPVKGAIALANALSYNVQVTLVSLKGGAGANAEINSHVKVINLLLEGGWRKRICVYIKLLKVASYNGKVVSLSYTFSADMVNLMCRNVSKIGTSVRGNLIKNYKMDYGFLGIVFAIFHLCSLRFFCFVTVMTKPMAIQVQAYSSKVTYIIPNFVDEPPLEKYRCDKTDDRVIKLVFVGTLSQRKQPLLLIAAVNELISKGYDIHLDVIGYGPLYDVVLEEINSNNIQEHVTMHNHLTNPYPVVSKANVFVLPSLSEGLSRAAMEALYLGLPCVMRDVDGNSELITNDLNGCLFKDNSDFINALEKSIKLAHSLGKRRSSLLPVHLRQNNAAVKYFTIVEKI